MYPAAVYSRIILLQTSMSANDSLRKLISWYLIFGTVLPFPYQLLTHAHATGPSNSKAQYPITMIAPTVSILGSRSGISEPSFVVAEIPDSTDQRHIR